MVQGCAHTHSHEHYKLYGVAIWAENADLTSPARFP